MTLKNGFGNLEKALFNWPIVLQYDLKLKYRLISRKFSGVKFFHPRLYPFNNPIKSLYFRLFVFSVLFARFHNKAHSVTFEIIGLQIFLASHADILARGRNMFQSPNGIC